MGEVFCSCVVNASPLFSRFQSSQALSSRKMFALATRNFVEEVEDNGSLIPVTSLNDTIALLTVVVRRRRFWCWQKSKYLPTDFNLNDILTGDTPIKPGKPQKQHENGRMCHSLLSRDHRNLIFFNIFIYLLQLWLRQTSSNTVGHLVTTFRELWMQIFPNTALNFRVKTHPNSSHLLEA